VCGNSHAAHIQSRWGARDYQSQRNDWLQNGFDAFLVELTKYRLKKQDLAANINLFSEVSADAEGKLQLSRQSQAKDNITLRFEMDTLVVLHTCPHPLSTAADYPHKPVEVYLEKANPVLANDRCLNLCDENRRGFHNNALYHLGMSNSYD
jgi:hypothetical protein